MKGKKLFILLMAAIMVITMTPLTASAASKKTVYVISKVTMNIGGGSVLDTVNYKYNKKGFVKSFSETIVYSSDGDKTAIKGTVSYNKKNQVTKIKRSFSDKSSSTEKFKYNKKGLVTKKSWSGDGATSYYYTYSYNKKKHLTKMYSSSEEIDTRYTCDSKGRITRSSNEWYDNEYFYDGKGNLKQANYHSNYDEEDVIEKTVFQNSYDGNRLVKKVAVVDGKTNYTLTFTYKKMKVKKSYVKKIKAQQQFYPNDPAIGLFVYH